MDDFTVVCLALLAYQQMYRVCTQNSNNDRTECADNVAGVFERARHSQNSRA